MESAKLNAVYRYRHTADARFDEPLALTCGRELPAYELMYETYGTLTRITAMRCWSAMP